MDQLIADGVDVNAKGKDNVTPLFWAYRTTSFRDSRNYLNTVQIQCTAYFELRSPKDLCSKRFSSSTSSKIVVRRLL